MAQQNNHLVIMAGGIGSRFWPMSTEERPKQFIDVLGVGRTLIQMTLDRFQGVCPMENVWIVTNERYADLVHEQLPDVPVDHILQEPCRRNTAPCIAYVSWRIKMTDPKANVVVSPADHIVTNVDEFRRVITSCLKFAGETDAVLTLGMKPTRPETGYGYIQADLTSNSPRNREIYRVDQFKEKPDLETAKHYISEHNFFWNAGIFVWNVDTITSAIRTYAPGIAAVMDAMAPSFYTEGEEETVSRLFPTCEKISIDYAVMEKAEGIHTIPASFGWSDLGTWGSLHENTERDIYGNALIGDNIDVYETTNCIVHATQEKRVVVQGLDGFIVAECDDTLLICRLSDEQRIKQFSENK